MHGDQLLYYFISCWYLDFGVCSVFSYKGHEANDFIDLEFYLLISSRGRNGFDRVVQRLRVQADENLISTN